jgi:hypothetical protein
MVSTPTLGLRDTRSSKSCCSTTLRTDGSSASTSEACEGLGVEQPCPTRVPPSTTENVRFWPPKFGS